MDAEATDIRQFLAVHPPFDLLPAAVLDALTPQVEVLHVPEGTVVLRLHQYVGALYMVRSGRIEIRGASGEVWAHRNEGETFGVRSLLDDGRSSFQAMALEDSTLLLIPDGLFARLKLEHLEFDRFFTPLGGASQHLAHAGEGLSREDQSNLIALRIRDLMTPSPLTVEAGRPVREAAERMREHRISCLPVTEGGSLVGILTNVDLRDRVVANGVPPDTPVGAVMTRDPITLTPRSLAYDALLAMQQRPVRHLPVVDGGRLVGIVTNTDVYRRQIHHPGYLSGNILRRQTPASLAEVVAQVPLLLVAMVETGASARQVGLTVTSIADITTYRLLQLAEERFGPPPVPYLWMCSGSQARQEQTGLSDQDNCMIIDDAFDERAHGPYFEQLARFVCDGLNACGYVYCPGEMMAVTPKWRQPLAQWKRYFHSWIEEPEPMAQMLASVQFDFRPIRGETRLFDDLQDEIFTKAKNNSLFIVFMVSNALSHTPPLGFFRNSVLNFGGESSEAVDLKIRGTVPIIDIARIHALRGGVTETNTHDRLLRAHTAGVLSERGMRDLLDALEFLSMVRLKHQSQAIRRGQRPDNQVSPAELSRIERKHLRDAFLIVQRMQASLASTYQIRR